MTRKCENCSLRELELFECLPDKQLRFLNQFKSGEMTVHAGSEILSQGSTSPQLYTVLEGMGLRYKTLASGRRQVIGFILPGDFIGLQAAVMSEMEHAAAASTPMRLCMFNRSDLWSLFKQQPQRAYDLVHLAAIEEYLLCESLTAVGQLDGMGRVAWALQRFFDRLTALNLNRNNQVPLPFLQSDLADALGLSLVHTNKTLNALRREGVATWSDRRLVVHDPSELRRRSGMDTDVLGTRPLI